MNMYIVYEKIKREGKKCDNTKMKGSYWIKYTINKIHTLSKDSWNIQDLQENHICSERLQTLKKRQNIQ